MHVEQFEIEEQQAYNFLDSQDLTFSFECNEEISDIMKALQNRYSREYLTLFPKRDDLFNCISLDDLMDYLINRYDLVFIPVTKYYRKPFTDKGD